MIAVHPQYITDAEGKKLSVILPINEFEALVESLEDLDDVQLFDAAKANPEEAIDIDDAFKLIESNRKG